MLNLPPNRLTPRIANINHTTSITIIALNTGPTDSNRVITIVFMPMFLEIKRNGRSVLSSLRTFRKGKLIELKMRSRSEVITIKKSS